MGTPENYLLLLLPTTNYIALTTMKLETNTKFVLLDQRNRPLDPQDFHLEILEVPRLGTDVVGKAVYLMQGNSRSYISFRYSKCRSYFVAWSDTLPNKYFGLCPHLAGDKVLGLTAVYNNGKKFDFLLESEIEPEFERPNISVKDDMCLMNFLTVS